MKILQLLDELEKLLTELLLWFVFIPRTLFRILIKPSWVPTYINEQLEKAEGRFRNFMSPVILFIISSLVLFFLFEYIIASYVGYRFFLPKLLGSALNFSSVGDIESKLTDVNTLIMALGFMILPIVFAVFIELFRKKGFTRANLHRAIYIQAYYFSPVFCIYFIVIIFYNLLPFDPLVDYGSFALFVISILWFSVAQIRLLRDELNLRKVKATFGYILMVLLLGLVSIVYDAIATIKSGSTNSAYFEKIVLPRSGNYNLSIRSRAFETLDYDVYIYKNDAKEMGAIYVLGDIDPKGSEKTQEPFEYTLGDTLNIDINAGGIITFFDFSIEYENDLTILGNDSLPINTRIINNFYSKEMEGIETKIHPKFSLDMWESKPTEKGEKVVWKTTVFDIYRLFYRVIWVFLFIVLIITLFRGMISKRKNNSSVPSQTQTDQDPSK